MRFKRLERVLVVLLFGVWASNVFAQSLIWRNDWYVQNTLQPPFFLTPVSVVSNQAGNVVVSIPDNDNYQFNVYSIQPDGTVAWQIPFGYETVNTESSLPLAADSDGSIYIGGDNASIEKVDANGATIWYRDFVFINFIQGPAAIYAWNCQSVSALDKATGKTLWTTILPAGQSCSTNLTVDETDSVYLSVTLVQDVGGGNSSYSDQILKLGADGSIQWSVVLPLTSFTPINLIGVAGSQLYTQSVAGSVAAYHVADGSFVWERDDLPPALVILGGAPVSPIVLGEPSRKLDAVNGQDQWSQTLAVGKASAFADGPDVYVGANDLARINGNTGAVIWDTHLTSADEYAAIMPGANSTVLVFGKRQIDASSHVDTIDRGTGQILTSVTVGSAPAGVFAIDEVSDSTSIVQSAANYFYLSPTDYLRSVNKSTGVTDWQIAYDTPPVYGTSIPWGPYLALSSTDGIATVLFAAYARGGIAVTMFNRSDGSQRWEFEQDDYVDGEQNVWASSPQTDASGDVYISYTAEISCPSYMPDCSPSSLIKFSKIDGRVIWRNDMVGTIGRYGAAANFLLVGNDVIVQGPFYGSLAGNNAVRFSGIDGSVMWANADFGGTQIDGMFLNNDGSLTLWGEDDRAVVDAASGMLKWEDVNSSSCGPPSCYTNSVVQAADGTIIGVGYDGLFPLFFERALSQGSSAVYSHLGVVNPLGRTILSALYEDQDATLWVRGATYASNYVGLRYLSKLDPTAPRLYDQQVLGIQGDASFGDFISPGLLGAPEADRLVTTTLSRRPGQPMTLGTALYDVSVAAYGDLAIQTSTSDGAGTSQFKITVTYSGDSPISHAQIVFGRASPNQSSSLTCEVTLASNCYFENADADFASAFFDIESGGTVIVEGTATSPLGLNAAPLYAVVAGPTSLAEPDLMNNFSRIVIPDEIFADGFQ